MSPAERMRGDTCEKETVIDVWPCNWTTVQVYLRCQQTVLSGMAGAAYLGVSASEAMASARMLRAHPREWPELIDGVQMLAGYVAKIENDKMKAKAEAESRKG